MDINELREKATKNYDQLKARRRELYKLARQYGFSPREAQVLSGQSEDTIHQLAKERNNA